MEESDFDQLLLRYVTGKATEDEKRKMDAWLDAVGDEPEKMQHLNKEDEDELYRRITSNVFTAEDVLELKSRLVKSPLFLQRRARRRSTWISGIAATILFLVMATVFVTTCRPDLVRHFAADETMRKLVLKDGSVISYAPGTSLAHDIGGEQRTASLTGEAFFEIAPDSRKPFVIRCEGVIVKVLGTSFRIVSHDATDFTLHVIHGRVEISTVSGGASLVVAENEMARFRGQTFYKSVIGEEEVAEAIKGVDYHLQFRRESFRDILDRLEKKFNVAFALENTDIGRCRVSVDLTGYSLDESLKILKEILDVDYRREGDTVTISGSGC